MKRMNFLLKCWSFTSNGFKVFAQAAAGRYYRNSDDIKKMREEIFREKVARKK
jgi:hypothetical protein